MGSEAKQQAVLAYLVACIVHEVNSPLGAIRSGAGTIRRAMEISGEAGSPERQQRSLEVGRSAAQTLEAASERISTLVQKLGRFVNLDQAEYRAVDVRDSLELTLEMLAPRLGGVAVERSYPQEPVSVGCYPDRLNMALMCLLENALAAMDGQGTLRVAVRRTVGGVEIEIVDSGRGIPAAQLAEITCPGLADRDGRIGLGLGLPYARQTAEQLGGSLTIESTEGQGTRVWLELPAAD